jgi:hypothetical protein
MSLNQPTIFEERPFPAIRIEPNARQVLHQIVNPNLDHVLPVFASSATCRARAVSRQSDGCLSRMIKFLNDVIDG